MMANTGGEAPFFLRKGWRGPTSFPRIIPDNKLLSRLARLVKGVENCPMHEVVWRA